MNVATGAAFGHVLVRFAPPEAATPLNRQGSSQLKPTAIAAPALNPAAKIRPVSKQVAAAVAVISASM
jgi:hypothetical protein